MVLRKAVKDFYFYEVCWTVGLRSIVKDLVRLQLVRWDILRVKLVVD